jgi:hypothetical protein
LAITLWFASSPRHTSSTAAIKKEGARYERHTS